jgi:ApbE superfamily uncharacterized protein (UPF0280 family)
MSASARMLPDGRRLHLHHGPIDVVFEGWGAPEAVHAAHAAVIARFDGLLEELVADLPALRSPDRQPLHGPIAQAMATAVAPFHPDFVTPMAAVAGAVADALLAAAVAAGGPGLTRAYANDGGDIALHLTRGESLTAAIAARPGAADRVLIRNDDPVRGVATSGWRGRSWSLGIADAVTVLAATAARADAAATLIANAVDLPGHPGIARRPAEELQADSDLGERLVTVEVPALAAAEVASALERGAAYADTLIARGLIAGAALFLQTDARTLGAARPLLTEPCLG